MTPDIVKDIPEGKKQPRLHVIIVGTGRHNEVDVIQPNRKRSGMYAPFTDRCIQKQ
jgi:hypothetical protein